MPKAAFGHLGDHRHASHPAVAPASCAISLWSVAAVLRGLDGDVVLRGPLLEVMAPRRLPVHEQLAVAGELAEFGQAEGLGDFVAQHRGGGDQGPTRIGEVIKGGAVICLAVFLISPAP